MLVEGGCDWDHLWCCSCSGVGGGVSKGSDWCFGAVGVEFEKFFSGAVMFYFVIEPVALLAFVRCMQVHFFNKVAGLL